MATPSHFSRVLLLAAATASLTPASHAADLYWDQNGATAGTGGAGNWNTTSTFWRSGSATGTLGVWSDSNVAVFGGTAGTVSLSGAVSASSINVLTTGYTIRTSNAVSTSLLTTSAITIGSGLSLSISGASSGAVLGGSGTLAISGGGTVTVTGSNRAFAGTYQVNGTGTKLVLAGTNVLKSDSTSSSTINVRSGGTVEITGTNNYNQTLNLGGSSLAGGTLLVGNAKALNFQGGSIQVSGNSKSVVLSTLANTGTTFGALHGGSSSRTFTVNALNDPSGIDLEYSAGWRAGTINKSGAGVMLLSLGFIINNADNYTTFNNTGTALTVSAGTFLNEGTVKSITNVNGGTLKTGSASGVFDQVNVTSGTFEISRSSDLFTTGLAYATGNNALNLRGGTLRYVGVNTDYSSVMGNLDGTSTINTNGQDVTFATGLAGTGGFTKSGTGTLTLSGANTFSGAVGVTGGTLAYTNAGNQTISGALSGSGDLTKSGAGRLTFSGASTFSGNLSVNEGSVAFALASNPTTGLASYDVTGVTPSNFSVGNLVLAAGTSAKLLVNGTAGTVANGTYSFLSLTNATLPDLGFFVAPVWSDSGSALGRRQTASLAYAGNILQMTVGGSYPIWSGSAGAGWSTADNWLLDTDSTSTSFLEGDAVLFNDSGVGGTVTISEAVSPATIAVAAATTDYTFAASTGSIAAGVLTKSGAASLTLTGSHGFSSVALSAGRLRVGSAGSLGAGTVTLSGGALSAAGTDPVTVSNAMTVSGNAALGDATDNGVLTLAGNIALGSVVRTLEVRSSVTLSGILSGTSAGLTKTGAGNLTLTGGNTFTGATRVSEGTLSVGAANIAAGYLGSTSGITVDSGATLLLLSDNAISGFSGTARSFTLAGTLDAGAYNTNVGALTLSGGELAGAATADGYGNFNLRGNVSVTENSTISAARFNTDGASRNLTVAADKTLTISGVLTNAGLAAAGAASPVVKLGSGSMRMTGASISTGTLTVAQGDVILAGGDDRLLSGGTVILGATSTSGRLVLEGVGQNLASLTTAGLGGSVVGGSATASTLTLSVASGTLTYTGGIGGAGTNENNLGLTKSGAGILDLSGTSSYSGATLVSTGSLRALSSGALGSTSGIALAANSTAQLILVGADLSFDRALTIGGGSGGVAGQGALHLSASTGTSTWSGPITVLADIVTGGHFGTGGATLVLSGSISAGPGVPVEFRNGTSVLSGAGSDYPILFLHSDATVRMGAANLLPAGVAIQMGTSGNAAIVDLNGFDQTAGSVSNATSPFTNTASGIRNNNASQAATLTLTGSTIGEVANTVINNTASATGVLSLSPGAGASLGVVLDTGSATPVINAGLGVTIGATLASANGFTKTGAGSLILTANNLSGLAGAITVESGALISRESGALGTGVVRLDKTSGLEVVRFDTKAQTHEVDFEVLESGDIRASGAATTLNSNFTLHQGKALRFYGLGADTHRFFITGDTALADGATSADVTFQIDGAKTDHFYAGNINLGAGTLTKVSGATLTLTGSLTAGSIVATASGNNIIIDSSVTAGGAGGTLVLSGAATGATLLRGGITAAAVTKTGTSTHTLSGLSDIDSLNIQEGSIILTGGANGRLGASSSLSLGAASTTGRLVLGSTAGATNQTLSALTLSGLGGSIVGGNGSADSLLTLDLTSDLSLGAFLGGTGANENRIGLAKSGAGVLTLSTANTFAGGTTLNAGTLLLGDVGALGTGTITVAGGILDLANLALTNAIVFAGGSVINNGAWAGSASITGALDNAYLASLPGSSFTIAAGTTVDLSSLTALGGKTLVYSGGTLTGSSNVLLEIADGTTLGAGFGTGRALVKTGSTVTLTSAFTQAVRYEGGTLAGLADYTGALTVGGNSTLDLDGAGNTAVATAASLTVEAGSTLKGTGTFGGGVISGVHAPGNSPGVNTSQGNLTYNAGASFEWELADNTDVQGDPVALFDQVIVNGDLTFAGATSLSLVFNAGSVDWANVFWDEARSWTLFDVSGALSGFSNLSLQSGDWNDMFGASLASARPGFTFSLSQSGSDVLLNYEAIPEPSTYGLRSACWPWPASPSAVGGFAADKGPRVPVAQGPRINRSLPRVGSSRRVTSASA